MEATQGHDQYQHASSLVIAIGSCLRPTLDAD